MSRSNDKCASCGDNDAAFLRLRKCPDISVLFVPVMSLEPPWMVRSCISNEALAPGNLTVVEYSSPESPTMVLPKKHTSPLSNEYVIPLLVEAFLKWIVEPLLTSKSLFNEVLFWNANVRVALFVTLSVMPGLEMYVVSFLISLPCARNADDVTMQAVIKLKKCELCMMMEEVREC